MWDSAASHLEMALSNATNKQEKARWEYLIAQLYEMSNNYKEAEKYYAKVIGHTTDPILDIYARLSTIRSNKDGGEKSIEKNVNELEKMAKRDKYVDYQDIIYYMAAQMQLEGKNYDEAIALLKKSTQVASNNPSQRNKAFLQLAELSYARQQYRQSYNFYDSLNLGDPSIKNPEEITARKKSLGILATNMEILERQDSLQRIAAMPEDERNEFVKKLVKQIRKAQGLKDDGRLTTGSPIITPTLFPTNNNQPKGEWYFYNTANRTRGQTEFKNKWGNRPNIDNWRRGATIIAGMQANSQQQLNNNQGNNQAGSGEASFEALNANLPLTPELLKKSNDSIQAALFALGKVYVQEIENCQRGTETLEQLRSRYPEFTPMDEVLFNLYYCYNKNGETAKASAIKKSMTEKHSSSNFTTIVTTGKNPQSKTANADATKLYEGIYDLFIEGKFEQAIKEKKAADSIYSNNYWTPQLLYIEAVYHIKQRNDSTAVTVLNSIISQFAGTPLAGKAANLLSVLGRRAQIELELKNMVVTRATDSSAGKTYAPVVRKLPADTAVARTTNPLVNNGVTPPTIAPPDTVAIKQPVIKNNTAFTHAAGEPHYVMLVLNKVDPVFSNEAKNAFSRYNRETYYNKTFSIDLYELDTENRLLMIAPFPNAAEAMAYIDKAKPKTATEIIPWLKGGKYSYSILTNANFDLLKGNKDLESYKTFLNQYFPGRF
jgi:outer membrane protein assembly factor BamD (BamD/ComL family)